MNNDDPTTSAIKVIQENSNWLKPESYAALTAVGPTVSGIAAALFVMLSVPNGYSMIGISFLFALLVVISMKDIEHSWIGYMIRVALCFVFTLVIFWQSALVSNFKLNETTRQDVPLGISSILIPEARAELAPATVTSVDLKNDIFVVQRGGQIYEVPVEIYNAIADWEQQQRRSNSPFKVRFKR